MTTETDDFLAHHGVLGMHWGKHLPGKGGVDTNKSRYPTPSTLTSKLKNGEMLTLEGVKTTTLGKVIGMLHPRIRAHIINSQFYELKDHKGVKVGDLFLDKKSPSELNVVWVETKKDQRGKGYGSAAMKATIAYAKSEKIKTVTLEVPGYSPDAKHIYEKLGFKTGKQITSSHDMWGGLTEMSLDLDTSKVKEKTMTHSEDFLAHHGVLGMKWGIRHDRPSSGHQNHPAAKKNVVRISKTKDTKLTKGELVYLGAAGVGTVAYVGAAIPPETLGIIGAPLYMNAIKKDLQSIKEHTSTIDLGKNFLNDKTNTDVPLGTIFHRVASYKESEINAPKYATYLQDDVLRYRNSWITPGRSSYSKHYVTKIEALKNVTIASPNSILETIEKEAHTVLSDGESLYQKYAKTPRYSHMILNGEPIKPGEFAKYVVSHNRVNVWGDDIGKATSEIMQKAGYSAVTDINNTGYMARKHAVIILDKAAFKVTSSRLTTFERAAAGIAKNRLAKVAAKTLAKKI